MASRGLTLREGIAPVRDRLLATLFLAALLHGLIILGLTFGGSAGHGTEAPGLEVLLVSEELPEADRNDSATYLAQRTQLGSGNTHKPVAPRNRASAVPVPAQDGSPDGSALAPEGNAAGSRDERVLTSSAWSAQVRYLTDSGDSGSMREKPLRLTEQAVVQPGPQDESGPVQLRGPEHGELWISPDTQAAVIAPYLDAWRRKVERIGTLNYPTAARRPDVAASPVLEVGIAANGVLERAVIRRSSGYPELDQAALEILKLASPFDPFPSDVAREYRVLRFAYEWQFLGGRVTGSTVTAVP